MRRVLMQSASLCLFSSWCFASTPAPEQPGMDEELKTWQGEWVLVGRTLDGKDVSKDTIVTTMLVEGKSFTYLGKEKWKSPLFSLSLNPSKSPRQFQATYEAPPGEWCAGKFGRQLVHGIYKLEGDKLTICSVHSSQARPTNFKGNAKGILVDIFERKKKGAG